MGGARGSSADAPDSLTEGRSRLQQAQEDVEEVTVIMLDNLNKANERGVKLEDLEDRADELLEKGKAFEKTTNKLKQKKRCENSRMKVISVAVGVVVVAIVIGLIVFGIISSTGGEQ
uniref:V-SNARE coiled-coil homology domain-containing protein n=1 Tax=Mola mola TaxID=94237 RepID=A0A3Q3WHH5_MOLML